MDYPPAEPSPRRRRVPHHTPAVTTPTKSIIVAVVAGLTALLATVQGRTDLYSMRLVDWLIVLVASLVAGLTVYVVPEKPPGE
jgi:TRAP-type uncharacterized transport system fused permease subunit